MSKFHLINCPVSECQPCFNSYRVMIGIAWKMMFILVFVFKCWVWVCIFWNICCVGYRWMILINASVISLNFEIKTPPVWFFLIHSQLHCFIDSLDCLYCKVTALILTEIISQHGNRKVPLIWINLKSLFFVRR